MLSIFAVLSANGAGWRGIEAASHRKGKTSTFPTGTSNSVLCVNTTQFVVCLCSISRALKWLFLTIWSSYVLVLWG